MDKNKRHFETAMDKPLVSVATTEKSKSNAPVLLDLEAFQNYISALLTSRISYTARNLVPLGERPAVINDVTQNTWVKILQVTKSSKLEIVSPRGYVASIANSEFIDEMRRRKRKSALPLPLDQDSELKQGRVLLTVHQGMRDPAVEYEFKESVTEIIEAVLQLPSKQMYVMICVLKDEVGHTFPLAELCSAHGIDISSISWPEDPKELQRLRSLLCVARRTLREKNFCY